MFVRAVTPGSDKPKKERGDYYEKNIVITSCIAPWNIGLFICRFSREHSCERSKLDEHN